MVQKKLDQTHEQELSPEETRARRVFVVSPIGAPGSDVNKKANYALTYIIRKALHGPQWVVERADEGESPDSIGHHVVRKLHEADLVIADLTDLNPNVFYELAIAHGWHKPVIHMMQYDQRPPFDVADMRTIFYDLTDAKSVDEAISSVKNSAAHVMSSKDRQATPLTQFAAFNDALSGSGPKSAEAIVYDELSQRLSRIERLVRNLAEPLRESEKPQWRPPMLSVVEQFHKDVERFNILYPDGVPTHEGDEEFQRLLKRIAMMWSSFDKKSQDMVHSYFSTRETNLPEIIRMF